MGQQWAVLVVVFLLHRNIYGEQSFIFFSNQLPIKNETCVEASSGRVDMLVWSKYDPRANIKAIINMCVWGWGSNCYMYIKIVYDFCVSSTCVHRAFDRSLIVRSFLRLRSSFTERSLTLRSVWTLICSTISQCSYSTPLSELQSGKKSYW